MIIEALAAYLATNSIGTVNTNIFIGELPFDTNDCISLMYGPSADSNSALNVYDQTIDIAARFTDSAAGYQKMIDIFNLLRSNKNYIMGGFHVYYALPIGIINDNDRDIKSRKLYSLSARFRFRIINEVS